MITSFNELYREGKRRNPDKPLDGIRDTINTLRTSNDWKNPNFHDSTRLHIPAGITHLDKRFKSQIEILKALYQEQQIPLPDEKLERILATQDVSILPLNLTLSQGVKCFLPTGKLHSVDSFGIKKRAHVVTTKNDGKEFYLATNKPDYATFLTIFGKGDSVYCKHGCANCYRGTETRELEGFKIHEPNGSLTPAFFVSPIEQIRELMRISNTNPRYKHVYDILLSGGEPLQESNETLEAILQEVRRAENINSFRICTGALFLGKPMRFDSQLIKMLSNFRKQTGKSVSIVAHIPHPDMITPESGYAVQRIRDAGIEIQTQTPLIDGINVFLGKLIGTNPISPEHERNYFEALKQSYGTMKDLMRKTQNLTGNRPYKWLNDTEESVPIEFGAMLWELWRQHRGDSDITRATSYAKFHQDANIDLSLPVIMASEQYADEQNKQVVTIIPQGGRTFKISQPIFTGINYPVNKMREFYRKSLGNSDIFEKLIKST